MEIGLFVDSGTPGLSENIRKPRCLEISGTSAQVLQKGFVTSVVAGAPSDKHPISTVQKAPFKKYRPIGTVQ
jgi:hypothetical protein